MESRSTIPAAGAGASTHGPAADPREPSSRASARARLDPRTWPIEVLAGLPPTLIGLALYVRTLMPGLGVWDTAEFQAIGPVLGVAHPTGYPTYTLLAWLASVVLQPFGDEALRANLLSALLVAAAAGLVSATVTMLTRRVIAGLAAGVGLALAEQAWRVALFADPHALHLFFVALLLFLLVGWMRRVTEGRRADSWLLIAAVVFGLSMGNHALTALLAPAIAIFVFAVSPGLLRRPRFVAACAAAAILTTVEVYAYLPIRAAMDPPLNYANPSTWEGFSYVVLGQQFQGSFGNLPPMGEVMAVITEWNWQQLGLLALAAPVGAAMLLLRRPALVLLLLLSFAATWWFSIGYVNAALERYYLGPLAMVALLGGLAVAGLIDIAFQLGRRYSELSAPRSSAWVFGAVGLLFIGTALLGAPDTMRAVDQSGNTDGRRWVDSVMPRLEQDAVVVSWWSFSTPMWYAQFVEGQRPDVFVVDDRTMLDLELGQAHDVIDRYLGERPVYLIRLDGDLPFYRERYELEVVEGVLPMWGGTVHRVVGPSGRAE